MKITKKELIYTFAEMVGDYEGTPTGQRYQKLWDALFNETLEIEGYTKTPVWHKFDASDGKTFPPREDRYLIRVYDASEVSEWYGTFFETDSNEHITHWAFLPKFTEDDQ